MMADVRTSIVKWLQAQPRWVQVVSHRILTGENVTEKVLKEILVILKSEEGQKVGSSIDFTFLLKDLESGLELNINSIGKIVGIDNLSPRVPLDFKGNMTVVYGHNGSGKSGYTRILKKASGKGASIELIPNIYQPKPETQKCTFSYTENGKTHETEWIANSDPLESLKGLDIFDSNAGGEYLEGESEASYLPNEVALFEKLVTIFDQLKGFLDTEIKNLPTKLPLKPAEFGNTKYLEGMYVKLKSDTDKEKVKAFYKYSEEDEKQQKLLEERIKTAPEVLAKQKRNRKKQLQGLYDSLWEASLKVSAKSCVEILKLKQDVDLKQKITLESADALKELIVLPGIGADTWKSMWLAAKKYSEEVAYKGKSYPNVDNESVCLLCQQNLDENAKKRFVGFESFVTSKLEGDLKASKLLYEKRLAELPNIPDESLLKTSIQASQLEESWFDTLSKIWNGISSAKDQILKRESEEMSGYALDVGEIETIKNLISELEEEALVHDKDMERFDLSKTKADLNELKSKKWVHAYLNVILEEIDRLGKVDQINGWIKLLNTKSISAKSGEVSEEYITEAYIKRFNDELKALGANKIGVELVKTKVSKGSVKHKIKLKNINASFSKISLNPLSEGEKRIVSLAAFLADVTGKPYKTPFVFDDPISSLDQTFEEKTANRLIELSKERQVIVFTHRLSLLGLLNDKTEAHCKHIRRESWGCGEHGTVPLYGKKPISALNDLRNDRLAKARKVFNEEGAESYTPLAKSICSDFRILLERVIEVDLMSGIVQRHKRGVTTKDKMKLLTKISTEDCELFESLMSDFSIFEHSQTDEAPSDLPNPDELTVAIDKVIEWHKKFGARTVA
jgi:energy-coupling factor transporter ATP-binding protein EcfA2